MAKKTFAWLDEPVVYLWQYIVNITGCQDFKGLKSPLPSEE